MIKKPEMVVSSAMLALADNDASKELMLSASQYFNDRRQIDDDSRKQIDQSMMKKSIFGMSDVFY